MSKINKQIANYGATFAGILVAVANAWVTIEWEHFEFTKGNIMKLTLSAFIAAGGYFSHFKKIGKPTDEV